MPSRTPPFVTRNEDALQAKLLARNLERLPEDRGGIALPPILRDHDVANVPTKTLEIWIERVTDRYATDDSGSGECKQECGRHVVRREILASLLFRQHLEIPPERHPLFIVVKKVPDARRRGSVGAKKLCFLRLPGNSQDKIHRLSPPNRTGPPV